MALVHPFFSFGLGVSSPAVRTWTQIESPASSS
jgi:hypothetical protein